MWVASLVGFLRSSSGRMLLLALFVGGGLVVIRLDATRDCNLEHLVKELAEANRLLEEARDLSDRNRARADETERELRTLRDQANDLLSDLPEGPGPCALDDDLLERLRTIQ